MIACEALPLELLEAGAVGEVVDVTGDTRCVARLAEMGLRAGCRLRVIHAGMPCLVQVGETRLSVRGDCATQVLVARVSAAVAV